MPDLPGTPPTAELARAVLDCVRAIPPGHVLTYGDVAEYVGWRGPRWVGRVLAEWGNDIDDPAGPVPWHRVVPVTGRCATHIRIEQMGRLHAEGVPVRDGRVDVRAARWRPAVPAGDLHDRVGSDGDRHRTG